MNRSAQCAVLLLLALVVAVAGSYVPCGFPWITTAACACDTAAEATGDARRNARDAASSQGPLWEFWRLRLHFEALKVVVDKGQPSLARTSAAARLFAVRTADDLPLFRDLMHDSDPGIRIQAMRSVGNLEYVVNRNKVCPRELIAALFDTDPEARDLAHTYVGCFLEFPLDSLPTFLALSTSDDAIARQSVTGLLYRFGWASAMALPELGRLSGDEDFFVRHNAANSLWHITRNAKLVVPMLVQNFTRLDEGPPEQQILRAEVTRYRLFDSARQCPREVSDVLLDLLRHPSPKIRAKAAASLGALAEDNARTKDCLRELQAEEGLTKLLKDSDEVVRISAGMAIKRIAE